jgi:signal transduction histidine kinase
MADTQPRLRTVPVNAGPVVTLPASLEEKIALLEQHRTLGKAPRAELEWLASRGTLQSIKIGDSVARRGEPIESLFVIFTGHIWHLAEQNGTWRKVFDWKGGDVTGLLPYSRIKVAPGNSLVEEDATALVIPGADVQRLPAECPAVTAMLVHAMLDRARAFRANDANAEKMASLGKLAAGLAHELNNPASAAARSATLLSQALAESDAAARALGAQAFSDQEMAAIEKVRAVCGDAVASVLSPLERSDREEAIMDWLSRRNVDDALAAPLAETGLTIGSLDELATKLANSDKLRAALHWVAAGCTVRGLTRDIERAASRVHTLVSAVKGFTYMDHAAAPEPVNVARGLMDTLSVMAAKARSKSVAFSVDAPADLPRVLGFGGELNQVWMNLVDNAIDATTGVDGGRVTASAHAEAGKVIVRIVDNGPGIPEDVRSRIFDPFFTTKPQGQGTGLGLDIVRRLVEQNNGLIAVESTPGRTAFSVSLPIA